MSTEVWYVSKVPAPDGQLCAYCYLPFTKRKQKCTIVDELNEAGEKVYDELEDLHEDFLITNYDHLTLLPSYADYILRRRFYHPLCEFKFLQAMEKKLKE